MPKKVVIAGAGPAGLTCAYTLLKEHPGEFDVLILEATGMIGGISQTVVHNGNRMDLGGHRFFTKDERVNAVWDAVMPRQGSGSYDDKALGREQVLVEGGPDPDTEDRVMLSRRRLSRIFWKGKFFDYPISLNAKTLKEMGIGTAAGVGFSYLASQIMRRPDDNLENFYINRFGEKLYCMFFEGYTEKLWGRHPSVISAEWGSQRVKGISVMAILKDMIHKASGKKNAENTERSLIERFGYPKYGPGQLWEQMAQDCKDMGAELRMGCEVVSCTVDGDSMVSSVTVRSDGGEESIGCDIFVSTMPLNQLAPGLLNEDGAKLLDWRALRIAAGLPYRDFLTVGLLVDKLAIENVTEGYPTFRNIPPDNWIYMQDAGVKMGRIQIFNNWSPYLLEDPENTVWLGLEYFCAEGDDFWNADDKWHLENTVDELRKIGILDDTCHTMDFHVERVKKAYPAYFDTYEELDVLVDEMRNKAKNLWCIGRNGMHNYGNMDHAMISAMLAADHIAAGDDSSANADVWEVNKDDEYHETK